MKFFLVILIISNLAQMLISENIDFESSSRDILFTLGQTLGNSRTFGLAVGDVDLDEDQDILLANYIGQSMLWINDGFGDFTQSNQYFPFQEDHDAAISDLNGDTYPDIFILSHATPCKVYFNDGYGNFTVSQQDIGTATDYPGMIVMDDVDDDGDQDAFISYYQIPNRLWLNDGNGYFTVTETLYGEEGNPCSMDLGYLNEDTYPDLILGMSDQPDQIWFNDGSGNFTNSGQELGSSDGHDRFDCGDIDDDGDNDVVASNSSDGIIIWLNQDNTGIFMAAGEYFSEPSTSCLLFDADNDSDSDLITIHSGSLTQFWLNDGSGVFTCLGDIFENSDAIRAGAANFDDDEDIDLVLGEGENMGGNPVYFNETVSSSTYGIITSREIQIWNYPNPFNPATEIKFQISGCRNIQDAEIEIYNIRGRKVKTIPIYPSSDYSMNSVIWNGSDQAGNSVSSSIYYYKLNVPDSPIKKMVLLK